MTTHYIYRMTEKNNIFLLHYYNLEYILTSSLGNYKMFYLKYVILNEHMSLKYIIYKIRISHHEYQS